jgi:small subunit ribosomal protein S16
MVKLRLARFGAKKKPYYRIVASDAHGKRDGRFLELLGTYNPRVDPPDVKIVTERAQYWLSVGAEPTDAVQWMLVKAGLLKANPTPKTRPAPKAKPAK